MIIDMEFVKPSYEKDAKQDQASAIQSAIPRRIKKHQIPLLSPSSTLLSLHKVVPDACVFTTIPLYCVLYMRNMFELWQLVMLAVG